MLLGTPSARAWPPEQEADFLIESRVDWNDAARSWTELGLGKLAGGSDTDGTDTTADIRLAVDYRLWLSETVSTHVTLDGYFDGDSVFGMTEGWLSWRPVPKSAWQHRFRAGSFIPPFSLEHGGTGWTSFWMPSASVLNGWLGEEVNVTGVEYTLRHSNAMAGGRDSWALRSALFYNNDTSGTLLSWRGWVATDRVTPHGRALPLPDRAAFRPGGTFPGVARTDPFIDTDQRPGYYVSGEWRRHRELRLTAAHYDNRADPLSFANGQAGWRTRFTVAGVHWQPAAEVDVLAQYGSGNTVVGRLGTQFSADNDFSAWYLLGQKRFGRHELALRYERFRVTDEDPNRVDDNREKGTAAAVAWQFSPVERYTIGVEFLRLESTRPERMLVGQKSESVDRRFRLLLRARF
jgi:hypothetical protein